MEVSQKYIAPLVLSFTLAASGTVQAKTHESDAHLFGDLPFSCDMRDLSHLPLEDRIENIIDANVFIQIGNGLGSGFVIDAQEGYIMTNNHVVEIAERTDAPITITLFDPDETDNLGEQHTATLVGRDSVLDIAILKVENVDNLTCVNLGDSDDVRLGQTAEAIGNPAGLSFSLSQGLVSNTERTVGNNILYTFIQTDTAINRGNSGGALFNDAGEVVGINFSILSPNGFNAGLGFAIKSNDAIEVADEIIRTGQAQRASMGVNLAFISDSIAEDLGLSSNQGARISRIEQFGPADLAGLQEDDVIREIDGEEVNEIKDARRIIGHLEPDDIVRIKVIRDRALQTIEVD
ncbi:MAG: S1C family serine protease, partial [Alphaproteobacteria bacterium]